jgi:hypothetical protein
LPQALVSLTQATKHPPLRAANPCADRPNAPPRAQGIGVVPRALGDLFGGRVGLIRNTTSDRLLEEADVVIAVGYVSSITLDCSSLPGPPARRPWSLALLCCPSV